eukprot:CAMPEP_0197520768 /NCGR_PEP_ID=MMETSP1318-20131121/6094_1 /TAXON_ID=552666 /ORGANISM="Partenskyella glossopodia, Strain RCC365" /LENGTH=251 /DNA_ID=CAMNT_0043072477 /DNA_START=33 /DNA_END=788 /DNA_ORIENTATION=-
MNRTCKRWALVAVAEMNNRDRMMSRASVALKRAEEVRLTRQDTLKAFYEARGVAIKSNKDRNRKVEQERRFMQRQQRENDENTQKPPTIADTLKRTTQLIPKHILAKAPPDRMKMLLAAVSASTAKKMEERKQTEHDVQITQHANIVTTTDTKNNKTQQQQQQQQQPAGGEAAECGARLLDRLIGAAVRDEDFLEAHRLKTLKKQLQQQRRDISESVLNEDFLAAHKAKKRLEKFLATLEDVALGCGEDED